MPVQQQSRRRRVLAFFAFSVVLLCLWFAMFLLPQRGQPFNASEWEGVHIGGGQLGPHLSEGNVRRYSMLDDLLSHHLHLGMKRAEVLRILGNPDSGDGTGEKSFRDVYGLVDPPTANLFWTVSMWLGFQKTQPILELEYGGTEFGRSDAPLISIVVR